MTFPVAVSCAVIIPARYASTRLPGKPLLPLNGEPMLRHVCRNAVKAAELLQASSEFAFSVRVIAAVDDPRVAEEALNTPGVEAAMTDPACRSGSDRALAACEALNYRPDIVVNLQGDAPLIPGETVSVTAHVLARHPDCAVATPVVRLPWEALDSLRVNKQTTPFSGTTAAVAEDGKIYWFSKNIIPAVRNEEKLRAKDPVSPVHKHFGLYGYRYDALARFASLPEGTYEALEGLEQLRFLENGMQIRAAFVAPDAWPAVSGVDSPEDAERAEAALRAAQAARQYAA